MTFIRSRVAFALIGLLIVGGISAAIAMMTTSQPLHAAVVGAGQANGSNTGSGAAAATTAPGAGGATTETTSTNTAPTATTPPAPATNPPSAGGQVIGVSGPIVSVNTSAGTFVMTVNGSSLTVVVTGSTNFSGDAKSLSQLQPGKSAEVHGVKQANGSLLATEVNADLGAGAGG